MPAGRKSIPKRTEKLLYQQVGSRCPVCAEESVAKLTIHHIESYAESQAHDPSKMIVLCANCHASAEAGEIDKNRLYELKARPMTLSSNRSPSVSQQVSGSNNLVAGRDVVVKIGRGAKRPKLPEPVGTVCEDPRKVGYLQYLAKRCNQFREWDSSRRGSMNYGAIHGQYQNQMKYAIRTTPLPLFESGLQFLQKQILNTKLGRILNARGQRTFSLFEEFDGHGDLTDPGVR